jgi:hypothetical protein
MPAYQDISLGAEKFNWVEKEIRSRKEEYICELKWQNLIIRCQDTTSACGTVNYKVCRIAITLYCFSPVYCEKRVNKSNHRIQIPVYSH